MNNPPLPVGSNRCRCSGCDRSFSSVGAFDQHHRIAKDGSAICLDPAERGLVLRGGYWSYPSMSQDAILSFSVSPPHDDRVEQDIHQGVPV